jgi:hypothetical protein
MGEKDRNLLKRRSVSYRLESALLASFQTPYFFCKKSGGKWWKVGENV